MGEGAEQVTLPRACISHTCLNFEHFICSVQRNDYGKPKCSSKNGCAEGH